MKQARIFTQRNELKWLVVREPLTQLGIEKKANWPLNALHLLVSVSDANSLLSMVMHEAEHFLPKYFKAIVTYLLAVSRLARGYISRGLWKLSFNLTPLLHLCFWIVCSFTISKNPLFWVPESHDQALFNLGVLCPSLVILGRGTLSVPSLVWPVDGSILDLVPPLASQS